MMTPSEMPGEPLDCSAPTRAVVKSFLRVFFLRSYTRCLASTASWPLQGGTEGLGWVYYLRHREIVLIKCLHACVVLLVVLHALSYV